MARSRPTPQVIPDDPAALAAIMDEMTAAGRGWINLLPEIPVDVPVPETPNALAVFSKRGPVVPLGTWTAPAAPKGGKAGKGGAPTPTEIGIQHGAAARADRTLAGTPGEIPEGWRSLSDNPRRGVVVVPPPGTSNLAQATWLLAALREICIPPQTGRFQLFRYDG